MSVRRVFASLRYGGARRVAILLAVCAGLFVCGLLMVGTVNTGQLAAKPVEAKDASPVRGRRKDFEVRDADGKLVPGVDSAQQVPQPHSAGQLSVYSPLPIVTLAPWPPSTDDSDAPLALLEDRKTSYESGVPGNYEPDPAARKNPASWPGENGKPVKTDLNGDAVRKANRDFGFNVVASDMVAMNRTIPDTRPDACRYYHYPPVNELPTASVVIVFHNEAWTPLLRTAHSVINRSPPELLYEVLMVDDASEKEHLGAKLETYIATEPSLQGKVRLVRNAERQGLIGARNTGAKSARAQVVIFLDAHCEAGYNWLVPLLAPIAADRRVMTVPIIDGIEMNTWQLRRQYGGADVLFRGIFEWGLLYKETEITEPEASRRARGSDPFRSPTHAGGLFAIDREWFAHLGYYDSGLKIWGGEQYELSFKIWMCGGGILFVPCSHVGHVYRNHMPYTLGKFKGPIIALNLARVVDVWMDEYGKYYYMREPHMANKDFGDVSEQKQMRERNHCRSFKWFMKQVAYDVEAKYPVQPDNLVWGECKTPTSEVCLDTMGQAVPGTLGVSGCHGYGGNQQFRLNVQGQMTTGEWCVFAWGDRLQTNRCKFGSVSGKWKYDESTGHITHDESRCLTAKPKDNAAQLLPCDDTDPNQIWRWSVPKR